MRGIFLAALAIGALMAPAAMAEISNSEARQIVKDLIAQQPGYGARVGQIERQGSFIVVHTLTSDGTLYRALKVDPESGQVMGAPAQPMTGKRDTGTNGG